MSDKFNQLQSGIYVTTHVVRLNSLNCFKFQSLFNFCQGKIMNLNLLIPATYC